MTKNNWLIPSLVALGIISVVLSLVISSHTEKAIPGTLPIARAELNLGKVFVIRKNLTKKEVLTKKAKIFNLDSIETSVDGDATLEFNSSYRVRVEENSYITIEEENDHINIIVKRGEVDVENFGQEGALYVSREGVRWNATEYETVFKKQPKPESLPDFAPAPSPAIAAQQGVSPDDGLNSELIQDTLKTHRNSFFRCYTQLIQKKPGIVGQASVNFTIENTGKVSRADIASTNINDAGFKRCLIDAITRIEFKSFSGASISTLFPIRFE